MSPSDTIVAISSTVGHAARIILRLSGPQSLPITHSLSPDAPPTPGATRTTLHLPDHLSFRSWLYTFPAPHSYTGEDLVELHLPGNEVLARLTLDHCVALGARPAEAGEFTARAYFNGRLNLTAAEGVAATIHASNESELRAARQLMAGALAKRLRPLMDRVAETLALVEVAIDFTDEEVTFLPAAEVAARAASVSADLAALATDSDQLERLSTEPTIVLVGRPNAGKSTLLNALAGSHRAVVSPIAGTTRDVLSADIALKRGIVKLLDVAGLEEPHSPPGPQRDIEESMRRRALDAVASADVVALVLDSSDTRPSVHLPRPPDLTILTKSDTTKRDGAISALTGDGLDTLRARLDDLAFGPTAPPNSDRLALNRRHLAAIDAARSALDRAASSAQSNAGPEVVALDLRDALDALGSILGVISPDDLLGLVFSRFCIGK